MNPISMELARAQKKKKRQEKYQAGPGALPHNGPSDSAGIADAHHRQRRASALTPKVAAEMKQHAQLKKSSSSSLVNERMNE